MCEECPLGLNAFLSTRHPKGLKNIRYKNGPLRGAITSSFQTIKSDGELHEIMIKSRGHSAHTGHGIEPTVKARSQSQCHTKRRGRVEMTVTKVHAWAGFNVMRLRCNVGKHATYCRACNKHDNNILHGINERTKHVQRTNCKWTGL